MQPNSFGPTSGEPKWPNPFGPTLGDRTPQRALAEPTSNRSPSIGQPSFFGPLSGRTLQMADPSARRTPPASPSAELCYKSELHWTNCRLQQDRTAPSSPYRTPCGPRLAGMAPTIYRTTPSSPYRTPCGPRLAGMAPTIYRTMPSSPYRTPCGPRLAGMAPTIYRTTPSSPYQTPCCPTTLCQTAQPSPSTKLRYKRTPPDILRLSSLNSRLSKLSSTSLSSGTHSEHSITVGRKLT